MKKKTNKMFGSSQVTVFAYCSLAFWPKQSQCLLLSSWNSSIYELVTFSPAQLFAELFMSGLMAKTLSFTHRMLRTSLLFDIWSWTVRLTKKYLGFASIVIAETKFNISQCQNRNKVMKRESVNTKTPNHFDYPAMKPTSKFNFNNNHQGNEFETEKSRPRDPSIRNIVSLFGISLKIIQIKLMITVNDA